MNIIFNDICKIEKINNTAGYTTKDSFKYQVFSTLGGFGIKLRYNFNDNDYSFCIYFGNSNKNEILEILANIKYKDLIKEFHNYFSTWCKLTLISVENKRDELFKLKDSLNNSYAKVSLNNHSEYLSYLNGNIKTLSKENIFEDDKFILFLSENKTKKSKRLMFELIEKETNISSRVFSPCLKTYFFEPKIFTGFKFKNNILVEFYETKTLNDVKKYLPKIVSSAIINNIPDDFIFDCERKYLFSSIIDFKDNNDNIISMKFTP